LVLLIKTSLFSRHPRMFLLALLHSSLFASLAAADASPRPLRFVAVTLAEQEGRPYYDQIVRGAERATKELNPDARYTALSCGNDADVQIRQIDEFVKSGVDLIVIQRSYAGDSSPAVQRARSAGVTVVAIDADVPGGTDAVVKPDEEQGGLLAGEYVARALAGRGKVAIANGPPTEPLRRRVMGFVAAVKKHPGLEIVENQDTGMTRMVHARP
jgi:ribose transport system substrate-binding protein